MHSLPLLFRWALALAGATASFAEAAPSLLECARTLGSIYSIAPVHIEDLEPLALAPGDLFDLGWILRSQLHEVEYPLGVREGYRGLLLTPAHLRFAARQGLDAEHAASDGEAPRVRGTWSIGQAMADAFGLNSTSPAWSSALAVIAVISCDRAVCESAGGATRFFHVSGDLPATAIRRFLVFDPEEERFRELTFAR